MKDACQDTHTHTTIPLIHTKFHGLYSDSHVAPHCLNLSSINAIPSFPYAVAHLECSFSPGLNYIFSPLEEGRLLTGEFLQYHPDSAED